MFTTTMTLDEINSLICNVDVKLAKGDKEVLHKYAQQIPKGGHIVDIGTCQGGSAFIMTLASDDSVGVVTIDPNPNPLFFTKMAELGLENRLEYLQVKSVDAPPLIDKQIDLLFVDGIHNKQGVIDDYNNFEYLLKDKAIVIFHDTKLYENTIRVGVNQLIDETKVIEIETVLSEINGVTTGITVTMKL